MRTIEQHEVKSSTRHPLYEQVSDMLEKLMGFILIYNSQVINQKEIKKYKDDSIQIDFLFKNCRIDDKTNEENKIETNARIIKYCKIILNNISERKNGEKYVAVLKAFFMPDIKGNSIQDIKIAIQSARNCDKIAKRLNISRRTLFYRKEKAINMFCEELEKFTSK